MQPFGDREVTLRQRRGWVKQQRRGGSGVDVGLLDRAEDLL